MAKKLEPVAMEQEIDHTACEACETCGGLSGYIEQVQSALADLGAPNPEDLIAKNNRYVRGARKAGMSPGNAAGMIIGLSGSDPTSYTPRYQLEEGKAEEYVAVDHRGKVVFGPTKDYQAARMHAERAAGYVKFHAGASEPGVEGASEAPTYNKQARLPPGYEQWERGFDYFPEWKPKRQHQSYAGKDWDEDWQVARGSSKWNWGVKQNDATSWSVFAIDRHGHQYHVAFAGSEADAKHAAAIADTQSAPPGAADAKFERCVSGVDPAKADPWAVCTAALGREPEPYARKNLNWHRADNGSYWNDDSDFGKIVVKQRPSDKRNQKLAWFAVVKKVEVVQGETRAEVNEAVEKHLRSPRAAAAAEDCTRIVSRGDVDVIERDPACSPKGVDISSPKKLHAAMRELVAKSGQERFWAIGQSKQGEMVGQPVELAVGQVDHVAIDVATFVGAAATLRNAGAVSVLAAHCHPSSHGENPSPADKDLTKRLKKGMDAIDMPFGGHYSMGKDSWARA